MKGYNALRGVVMALGFVGTLILMLGLLLTLTGASIVLPGLGLVLGGEVVLVVGLLIIAGAVAVDDFLYRRRPLP